MNTKAEAPNCYIIAGPNGSGKTTFAMSYLPKLRKCRNFINADLIASGISPLAPESVAIEAGKLFLKEINSNIAKRRSFAFETTLSGKGYLRMIRELRIEGWNIELIYLWIPSSDFSRMRVKERVRQGGHNIPEDSIIRRFPRSISNLINLYSKCGDLVICYDNSGFEPDLIFEQDAKGIRINNKTIYETLLRDTDDR